MSGARPTVEIIDFMIDPAGLAGIDPQAFVGQLETRLAEEFPGTKLRIHHGAALGAARVTMADWRTDPRLVEERIRKIADGILDAMRVSR